MAVFESITLDMTKPLPGGKFEIVSASTMEYSGPVALAKGDSTVQAQEKSQASFNTQLQQAFQTQFGKNIGVLNLLNNKLTDAINNPQGFSPEALAAMRTSTIQNTATDYANAARTVNQQVAARGGNGLPSGVMAQVQGGLAQGAANEESSGLNQIMLANEQQRQNNYWNAIRGLGGVSEGYNPNASASEANQGAGEIASLSQANTQANNSGWFHQFMGGLGSGLGAGLSSFATGGLSNATGWGKPASQPTTPTR